MQFDHEEGDDLAAASNFAAIVKMFDDGSRGIEGLIQYWELMRDQADVVLQRWKQAKRATKRLSLQAH